MSRIAVHQTADILFEATGYRHGNEHDHQAEHDTDHRKTNNRGNSFSLFSSAPKEPSSLGHTNFGSLINKIRLARPDCVYAMIVGGSTVAFYKQLRAAGITGERQFLLTPAVTEDEMTGIGGQNFAGFYSCMKYFQSVDTPANHRFVRLFRERHGARAVIGDVTQAAWLGPWLWKAAVERAGSFGVDQVIAASPGIELADAPEGPVRIDANHHLWSRARVAQGQADGSFRVVAESDRLIRPDPFPQGYR